MPNKIDVLYDTLIFFRMNSPLGQTLLVILSYLDVFLDDFLDKLIS